MSSSSQTNDLKNRIIFTIFILAVYRFGTFVPIPGIDPEQLQTMMSGNQKGLLGMFNVFAGGAVGRMAIFALGIMPYISSSIIISSSGLSGSSSSSSHPQPEINIIIIIAITKNPINLYLISPFTNYFIFW